MNMKKKKRKYQTEIIRELQCNVKVMENKCSGCNCILTSSMKHFERVLKNHY